MDRGVSACKARDWIDSEDTDEDDPERWVFVTFINPTSNISLQSMCPQILASTFTDTLECASSI